LPAARIAQTGTLTATVGYIAESEEMGVGADFTTLKYKKKVDVFCCPMLSDFRKKTLLFGEFPGLVHLSYW